MEPPHSTGGTGSDLAGAPKSSKSSAKGKGKGPPSKGKDSKPGVKGRKPLADAKKAIPRPPPLPKLKDDTAETLKFFKTLECYSGADVLDTMAIDWSRLEDVAVIKGSLEIDEAMTGIVVAKVDAKLVAFRNIATGRGANPVCEYFSLVLSRLLNCRSDARDHKFRLAEFRVVHFFSAGDEYNCLRTSLCSCIQRKTGLKGLSRGNHWLDENPGFNDLSHDLVRVLLAFFNRDTGNVDPREFTDFSSILEVVRGLCPMQDKMTLSDEVQIDLAMGLDRSDPNYIRRVHVNPLYSSSSDERARILWEIGKLTAFDAVINNMDRINVDLLWDNKGNFTNVMVEQGTLQIVGIDQMIYPIDAGTGLHLYRKRLSSLVDAVRALERSGFEAAQLRDMDTAIREDTLCQQMMEFETMLEMQQQQTEAGKALLDRERAEREGNPHYWLRKLQRNIANATGVFFDIVILAKHFVRGLADGFRLLALDEDLCASLLQDVVGLVREAFDRSGIVNPELRVVGESDDYKTDQARLPIKLKQCSDFVHGNIKIIAAGLLVT